MLVVSRNAMQVSLTWSLREEAGCDRYILYTKSIRDLSKFLKFACFLSPTKIKSKFRLS